MDYKNIAKDVLKAIGGKENVSAAAHCATRLRLVLMMRINRGSEQHWMNMDVVKGTFSTGGQFQIILGSGTVNVVYKAFGRDDRSNGNVNE